MQVHYSRIRRWVIPAVILLGLSALFFGISVNLDRIENTGAYRLAMNGVHLMLFICVAFGSLFLYPWMFFRGASLGGRVCGSLITPLTFVVKEVIRVREFFTWGESLYYAVSPVLLLLLIGQVGLMGLAEMVCRAIGNHHTISGRSVFSPGPVAAILAALTALYVFLLWGWASTGFISTCRGIRLFFYERGKRFELLPRTLTGTLLAIK